MSNKLVSFSKTRKAKVAVLAVVSLIVPTAVSRASAVSTNPSNHVAVSSSSIANWSPAATWSVGNDPQNCGSLVFPANTDIYHWLVQSESENNGLTGRSRRSWTYEADFTNGGSVDIEFIDGSKATYPGGTFGLSNIQKNHLYTALPIGSKIKNAWLNYNISVSGDTASAPVITELSTNHNLSHSCASAAPTVVIDSAVPTYTETWEEWYSWSLDKLLNLDEGETAKEKFYDAGKKPEFKVEATRSETSTSLGWAIVDGTQKVSGTFTVTNASRTDVTITLTGATCTTSDDSVTTDSTFNYECIWDTEDTVNGEDGLKDLPFTVDASVTTSSGTADASLTGKFDTQSAASASSGTFATTASLEDDLAEIGGTVIDCIDCTAEVTNDGVLKVSPTSGSFTAVYSVDWSWDQFKNEAECTTAFTNTAELTVPSEPGDESPSKISDFYVSNPSCPPPTVTLKNIDSSYDVTYDNTYSWTVSKEFDNQDDATLNAKYTVTATRTGPEVSNVNVVDGSATITGEYETEFADLSNVEVTVSYDGKDFECAEDSTNGTFECTITGLDTDDEVDGLKGGEYVVTASVDTGGGNDTDTDDGKLDAPNNSTPTDIHKSARIVDDLGGFAALNIACAVAGSADACWDNSGNGLAAGSTLTTDYAESTITVTYELDWLSTADTSAECPSIKNVADVEDGEASLDDAESNEQMTCPEAVITLGSTDPTYDQTWTESYEWDVVKTFKGQDTATWKPIYEVTATRGDSTIDEDSHAVVDTTQKVEGTFTLEMKPAVFTADRTNTDVEVSMSGAECTIGDDEGSGLYPFTCVVTDEDDVDSENGLNGVSFSVDAKAEVFKEEKTDTLTGQWGDQSSGVATDYNHESGRVVDSLAAANGGVVLSANASVTDKVLVSDWTTSSITVKYLGNWDYSAPGACGQSLPNTAEVVSSLEGPVLDSATISNTMTCLSALPGLTIGYWGNKMGGKEVVAKKNQWQTSGPWTAVLASMPNFSSDADVRNYMTTANCSGDCKTMFRAQALASVMNTLRNNEYQNQWVKFQGVCTKVQTLLDTALGGTTILNGSLATRIAYKTIFDDLNNSRATRCPGD